MSKDHDIYLVPLADGFDVDAVADELERLGYSVAQRMRATQVISVDGPLREEEVAELQQVPGVLAVELSQERKAPPIDKVRP